MFGGRFINAQSLSEFEELYKRCDKAQLDNVSVTDIMFVVDMWCPKFLQTADKFNDNYVYWLLLSQLPGAIEFGKWITDPANLRMNLTSLSKTKVAANQRQRKSDVWDIEVNRMFKANNLPRNEVGWRRLMLKWLRNPKGFQQMLQAARLLVDIKNFNVKEGKLL